MSSSKNLLAQENGQYYASMDAVEENVQNYMSLVTGAKTRDSDFIRMLSANLQQLLSTLRSQEQAFYTQFGLSGPQALATLQQKINIWNGKGAHVLFEQSTIQEVYDIVAASVDEAGLLELVNEYLATKTDWISEQMNTTDKQADIASLVNKMLQGNFQSSDTKGLNAQLHITITNGKFILSSKENTKMSNGMKSKLLELLSNKLNEEPTLNAAAIRKAESLLQKSGNPVDISEEIINVISHKIPGDIMSYIAAEIRKTGSGAYARWGNIFVIKGYLGEIYWNSCMNYLFGQSVPMGNQKNIAGKSLSVDMLVGPAGFQIKAWSLKQAAANNEIFQTHTSINNLYFGNFLQSRAQILEEYTGQTIARLFGSISYNKPNLDYNADETSTGQSESYNEFYSKTYSDWTSTMDDLALLFRANLGNILGISGKGGMMSNGTVYYNTFWAINDKIIPSSLIIEELLYSVQSLSSASLVTFRVDLKEAKDTPVWNKPSNFSDLAMANRWKIQYETCFNMSRLLEAAAMKN